MCIWNRSFCYLLSNRYDEDTRNGILHLASLHFFLPPPIRTLPLPHSAPYISDKAVIMKLAGIDGDDWLYVWGSRRETVLWSHHIRHHKIFRSGRDAEWSPPSIRAKASFTRAGTAPSCFLKSWQIPPLGRILRVFLLEAGRGPIFFHWLKSFRLWEKVCGQMDICHHHGQMCNDSLIHSYMVFYSHTDHKDILKATIKVAL